MSPRPTVLCALAAILLGLAASSAPCQAETLGPSLVANGGFEIGSGKLDTWGWGTADPTKTSMSIDDTAAHSGKFCLHMHSELAHAPNVFCGVGQTVHGIEPGTEYVLRLWAKGKGANSCWFGGGPGWSNRKYLPDGDFGWKMFELRWQAPDTPTDYDLRINVDAQTQDLWIDDVSFQQVNPLGLKPRVRALAPAKAVKLGYLLLAPVAHGLKIDGDLSDWPAEATVTRMPEDAGLVSYDRKGDADLSAGLRAAADSKNLYLGITVRDDVHWVAPGALDWTNDSIQLGIDPRHERTQGGYGPHDSEYSLMMTQDGKPRVKCWQTPQGLGDRSKDFDLAVKQTGHDTVYEVAIPWSAIGAKVGPGGPVIGLDVLINDNDGSGRRGYIELTGGIGRVKDPSEYVTAISKDRFSVAVLPARPIAYLGEPVDLKAVVVLGKPLAHDATVELDALNSKGAATPITSATLAAGTGGIVQLASRVPGDKLPASTRRVRVRVVSGGTKIADGTAALEVSDVKGRLTAEAARLKKRTAEVDALAKTCEARGIATDYERVAITVAQQFVGFALDDLAHDRPARAEHVLAVIDHSLTETARKLHDYLDGRAKPLLVPRFVTSKISVHGGAFWADTLVPTTGQRERRPVFFTGFGHFGTVVRDLPELAKMGVNIIQIECGPNSTEPAEGVVTGQPVRDYIGKALKLGEKDNVTVCFLTSPHYFPAWALKKWPELTKGGGGFFGLAVDAPQARKIYKIHLETSMKAVGDSLALHSVCLSNEPVFTNWQHDPFRRAEFTKYLANKFGTIAALNQAWRTSYDSFADVPILATDSLPREADMTPLRYEMARFNMLMFSQYHKFMSDVVHDARPGTLTHAKVMCIFSGRQALAWGCDPEQFAWMGDLNGNDCSCMYNGLGDQYAMNYLGQNAYYDLQRSMREVPVINTEDHIIRDREQRLIPAAATDFAMWQGAIHGQGAACIWVWERTYDRTSDFEGSIMHRPENTMAVGRVALDLQRLAPQVVELQRAHAPVAIVYSLTAQLWSDDAYSACLKAYEALNQCGVPVRFVSERQAANGELRFYKAVIAPSLKHAPDSLAKAIAKYCQGGGKLWVVGDAPLCGFDEYNRPRSFSLPTASVRHFPGDVTAKRLRGMFLAEMKAEGIHGPVQVTDRDGNAPWGLEYRAVHDRDGVLVSIANLWGEPQTVRIAAYGQTVRKLRDLRKATETDGATITLQPMECTILRVE